MAGASRVPVIAAGGIADGRGIAAAFALGAAGVQIGTAYLRTPESRVSAIIRARLATAGEGTTAITNVMTGARARGDVTRAWPKIGRSRRRIPGFPACGGGVSGRQGGGGKARPRRFHQCLGRAGGGRSVASFRPRT